MTAATARSAAASLTVAATSHLDRTLPALARLDRAAVERLCRAVARVHERGGTVFVCGNGGSASTASHFAQDLAKSTIPGAAGAERMRVLALTDSISSITAWANDHGYDAVFEGPLRTLGRSGDLLIALSGSGNSPNVLRAVACAREHGLETFGLTGFDGGRLKDLAEDGLHVDVAEMEIAENVHMVAAHMVVCAIRDWMRERMGD